MNYRILVVDDDENHRIGMMTLLEEEGYEVDGAANGREGIERLDSGVYDLVITDYRMNEMDGMRFLKHLQENFPALKVIMVTGYGSIEHAVEAMQHGAMNYITKPVKPQKLLAVVDQVLKEPGEEIPEEEKLQRLSQYFHFHRLVGRCKKMQQVYRKIRDVAPTDVSVMIIGESGTGKELVARAIHDYSKRKNGPFVAVNTGAIPRELIASELFGHLKGAFTGAISDKKGKFEEAHGGTLFLDEISTMSLPVQISLLRVLENHIIERVGSNRPIHVDVRIITATNEDLQSLIEESKFREDLYYRLNVYTIELPPLREREMDIPYLAHFFREMFNLELGRHIQDIAAEVLDALQSYPWPGNIREFRNVMLRAVLTAGDSDVLKIQHLPREIVKPGIARTQITFRPGTPLSEVEKTMILETLKAVKGNKLKAAKILGISRRSLYNKLEEYGIEDVEL
ncbi:MAG: sigma-54-dependent Fis family transcriptional regulator [Calditrichaeota bacterium]|nr:sigma-54-dependent Fis family transcriptional regulator [Calditrichota bacterium]